MTDETRQEGRYTYDGQYSPRHGVTWSEQRMFSVGIFRWEPKANSKGLKKGKVVYRVKGSTAYPERVYREADMICDLLNSGGKVTGKSTTVCTRPPREKA